MNSSQQATPSVNTGTHQWAHEITPTKARGFLTELANLRNADPAQLLRFARLFGPWVTTLFEATIEQTENGTQPRAIDSPLAVGSLLTSIAIGPTFGPLMTFAQMLRHAWERPTTQQREIGVFRLLLDASELYGRASNHRFAIAIEPIGIILLEAIHSADRMRICGNPECAAPYFIATRRSQKFCSEDCTKPAQREYKRRWWNEHGTAWQKNRSRKQRKSKAKTGH
jgi:hypothetical protein